MFKRSSSNNFLNPKLSFLSRTLYVSTKLFRRRQNNFTIKACADFYWHQNAGKLILKFPLHLVNFEILIQTSLLFFLVPLRGPSAECLCSIKWFNSYLLKLTNLLGGGPPKINWARNLVAHRNNLPYPRKNYWMFLYFRRRKNRNDVLKSVNIDGKNRREKVQINKLTWATTFNRKCQRSFTGPNFARLSLR